MTRKLEVFDQYQYGVRGVLRPGDKFRVSGGPFYVNGDGSKSLMAERGTFVFVRYCVRGAKKWIEARHVEGGNAVLWVGKVVPNGDLPSFKRRPYKVSKLSERTRRPGKRARKPRKPAGQSGAESQPAKPGPRRGGRPKTSPSTSGSTLI